MQWGLLGWQRPHARRWRAEVAKHRQRRRRRLLLRGWPQAVVVVGQHGWAVVHQARRWVKGRRPLRRRPPTSTIRPAVAHSLRVRLREHGAQRVVGAAAVELVGAGQALGGHPQGSPRPPPLRLHLRRAHLTQVAVVALQQLLLLRRQRPVTGLQHRLQLTLPLPGCGAVRHRALQVVLQRLHLMRSARPKRPRVTRGCEQERAHNNNRAQCFTALLFCPQPLLRVLDLLLPRRVALSGRHQGPAGDGVRGCTTPVTADSGFPTRLQRRRLQLRTPGICCRKLADQLLHPAPGVQLTREGIVHGLQLRDLGGYRGRLRLQRRLLRKGHHHDRGVVV